MTPPGRTNADVDIALYMRVAWRMVPLLFISYVTSYLDRVNVGFAKLEMVADLRFSDTVYGLGAGVFFLGYFVFEVPSNMILHRVGARNWIARIMITWGVISAATMAVKTPGFFYLSRFALGVGEAGFFPGILYYLTHWFPSNLRARMVAAFLTAIPLSGAIGGPLSGWIMHQFAGRLHLAGWQWLFLLEGIPSVVLGFAVLAWLPDSIRGAKWLDDGEKRRLESAIAEENRAKIDVSIGKVFFHRSIVMLSVAYFIMLPGLYGLAFWMPQIIRNSGVEDVFRVGLLVTIPYCAASAAMVLVGRSSDRMRERRWHLVMCLLACAAGFVLIGLAGTNTWAVMTGLVMATCGTMSTLPVFWTLPTRFLGGTAAAAGIALINSIGNLAGLAVNAAMGALNDVTHSQSAGLYLVAGTQLAAVGIIVTLLRRESDLAAT